MASKKKSSRRSRTSWDPLAAWYDGWVGKEGSQHHQKIAVPAVLELLQAAPGEKILDIGCGQGVLAPGILAAGAAYTGVDASPRLIQMARRHHPGPARFMVADAGQLQSLPFEMHAFDAAVFLLSIQDMEPLDPVLDSLSWAVGPGGRVVLLMTHPAFRVPRQSGWGWDENRKLQFRRVDRYLSPLPVPLKPYPGGSGVSRSYHRPISFYINSLAEAGFLTDRMVELPTYKTASGPRAKAENLANQEIPLFLGLRAHKGGSGTDRQQSSPL